MAETNVIEDDDRWFADLADQIALMINMDDDEEEEKQTTSEPESLSGPCKMGRPIIDNTSQHGCHTPWVSHNDSHAPVQRELVTRGIQAPADLRIMHQILPIEVINLGISNRQYCISVDGYLIPIETANRGMVVQRESLGTGVFIPRSFQNCKSKSQKNRGHHSLHNPKNCSFTSGKSTA